jgi:methyl-accepting chemotaxis protein
MAKPQKFERKHFFINRELQGRYMLTFLVPMLVMLVFMLFTVYFAAQSMLTTTTTIIKDDIAEKTATHLQDRQESVELYQGLLRDIRGYLRDFSTNEKYRRAVLHTLLQVLGIGIFLVILQIGLLTIFFSHKLAGPIYRFERVCHGLIEGNYNQKVVLRRGDEMQNLAALLNETIATTRRRLVELRDTSDDAQRRHLAADLALSADGDGGAKGS